MFTLPVSLLLSFAAFAALTVIFAVIYYDRVRIGKAYVKAMDAGARVHAILENVDSGWLMRMPDKSWAASPTLASWLGRSTAEAAQLIVNSVPEIGPLTTDGATFEKSLEVEGRWMRLEGRLIIHGKEHIPFIRLFDISTEIRNRQVLLDDRQKLRATLENISQAFNALPFPIWRRGEDLAIDWANDAYVAAVSAADLQAVTNKQIELASGVMAKTLQQDAKTALTDNTAHTAKHFVVVGDQRRAIQINTIPLAEARSVISYGIDITDMEELGTEISRLTEAHKETLNTMTTAVAIFAPDKTLDYFNQPFAQLWQLSDELLESHPNHGDLLDAMREKRQLPEQVNFKSWRDEHLAQYTDVLTPQEEYWHRPDGRTLRVVTHAHPMGGILQLFEDVTDRLALERSFNTLIAVQSETLSKLHEGVAVFSTDGLLKLYNPAYTEMWHIDEAHLDGEPHVNQVLELCADLFGDEQGPQELRSIILGGQESREVRQGRLQRTDGTVVDYAAVPLPDGGTLMTYLDVTDRLQIENALMERNEALETADHLKSEFVAHVSYELRTPLNSIIGFSEILEAEHFGTLNEKQKEYVADIVRASESLRALINDILDLSMIEAGAMSLNVEDLSVRPLLAEVVGISAKDIDKKHLSCTIECPRNVGAVEGDRKRLIQIIYNLVSNAIKYTPENGSITVGARRRKGIIELFVQDSGVGIANEEQEKVFQKFHTSPHSMHSGAGLGLSLVRSFVEMHHGDVVLTSEPNKGTLVTCSLPRRQDMISDSTKDSTAHLKKDDPRDQAPSSTIH